MELCLADSIADRHGPAHAGTFVRRRRICLEASLQSDPEEFARIFTHELFHFVWVRLGNPRRRSYENLVCSEIHSGVRGELGWSAEWRKRALSRPDRIFRTHRWREYVCESFCDSAAWLYAARNRHPEFTLPERARARRRRWFESSGLLRRISI